MEIIHVGILQIIGVSQVEYDSGGELPHLSVTPSDDLHLDLVATHRHDTVCSTAQDRGEGGLQVSFCRHQTAQPGSSVNEEGSLGIQEKILWRCPRLVDFRNQCMFDTHKAKD